MSKNLDKDFQTDTQANSKSLVGKCLVYIGNDDSDIYDKSVVYITESSNSGTKGIIINKLLFGTASIECKKNKNKDEKEYKQAEQLANNKYARKNRYRKHIKKIIKEKSYFVTFTLNENGKIEKHEAKTTTKQSPEAIKGLRYLISWIPAIIAILSAIFIFFYPLTTKRMKEINSKLKESRK